MRLAGIFGLVIVLIIQVGCARQNAAPPESSLNQRPAQSPYLEHKVRYSGETLAVIANWYTGNSANWKTIKNANPSLKPERMRIGDIVLIPRELVTKSDPLPERLLKRTKRAATENTKADSEVSAAADSVADGAGQNEPEESKPSNYDAVKTEPSPADSTVPVQPDTAQSGDNASSNTAPEQVVPDSPPVTNEAPSVLKEVEDAKRDATAPEVATPPAAASPEDTERERLLDELLQTQ